MNALDLHLRVPGAPSCRAALKLGPEMNRPEHTDTSVTQPCISSPPPSRLPTVPLPLIVPLHVKISWLLVASPAPKIIWDLGIRPQHACAAYQNDEWCPKWLDWPATNPPVLSMTLRADNCEKVIVVHAGVARKPFVTILDVLSQVFRAPKCAVNFKANCHCNTCDHKPQSDGVTSTSRRSDISEDSLLLHATSRGRRARRPRAVESTAGPGASRHGKHRRDSHRKKGRWIGLRASSKEHDVWELVLDQE